MITHLDVEAAATRLSGIVSCTPALRFPGLYPLVDGKLYLKLESFQIGGAFKFRGAYHAISRQVEAARRTGVVTGSSGNHGTAVALAAKRLGVRAVVVMPTDAALVKRRLVAEAGGEVILCGRTSDERLAKARELAEREGLLVIPPYDHQDVIAGQGTVALEAMAQVRDAEVFLAPCGGGGLIAGSATWLAGRAPKVAAYAVEAETANDTWLSFRKGERTRIPLPETMADGMRNLIPGELSFPLVRAHCRDVLLVSDAEIATAVATLFQSAKLVVEPTGAASVAAVLSRKIDLRGRTAIAVVSGGNADPAVILRCLDSA